MKPYLALAIAFAFLAVSPARAGDTRADFLKVIQRPRVPLAPEEKLLSTNNLVLWQFSFASTAEQRVPGFLLKAENSRGKLPVVIALHGTGGSKSNMLSLCRKLADKGFIAVAIDGRYHGDRRVEGRRGTSEYDDAIVRSWRDMKEHALYYDTVWDVIRLLDYLETRDDVDPKRIGVIGISKGGIETYLCAAVDPRIAVAVPCIAAQSFSWALDNDQWQPRVGTIASAFSRVASEADAKPPDTAFVRKFYDRVVPGIAAEFDGPAMLPLIAPRPLLVINGDSDDRTPLPGVELCAQAARAAYRAAHAEDHFALRVQEKTGHTVKPESERAAIEWFARWLKPQ